MTEFAFSGVGWNPHYDTPANPFDRAMRRIPGGSSSGAAVSVADDMAVAAIGTDTGGSVRIPAALCGLVGFKPTARRVPLDGCLPLSPSLDSIGPLARSVDMCTVVDAVLSGDTAPLPSRPPLRGRRLLVPTNYVIDGMEPAVADAYGRALDRLAKAGAILTEAAVPELADLPGINAKGGFSAPEALAWHRDLLLAKGDAYDRRVRARMERALGMTAVDYIDLLRRRREVQQAVARQLQPFDALVMPTVPIVAPPIAAIAEDDAEFTRVNLLLLRNPSVVNFLDGCALTLPCHRPGEAPVGLSLVGLAMQDRAILGLGRAVESALVAV